MATGHVELTRQGPFAEITFHNPDEGLMDQAMESQLVEAVAQIDADPGVNATVRIVRSILADDDDADDRDAEP